MSNEVAVAIVGAIGVMMTAILAYLGIVQRRHNGNGQRHGTTALTEQKARELIAEAMAARDREVERAGLLARVNDLEQEITALRQQVRVWQADAQSQQARVRELEQQNELLMNQIAAQEQRIESQAREIVALRAQVGELGDNAE